MEDEGPGRSGTYFSNYSEDLDALKQEVKQAVDGLVAKYLPRLKAPMASTLESLR
jgi:hypothetical protein